MTPRRSTFNRASLLPFPRLYKEGGMRFGAALLAALAAIVVTSLPAHAQDLLEQAAGGNTSPPAQPAHSQPAQSQPAQSQPASPDAKQPASHAPAQQPMNTAAASHDQRTRPRSNFSLFAVSPPPPRAWAKHDLVEIIINESSLQKFEQTQDLKKNGSASAQLSKFPSLKDLFTEAALTEGIGATKPGIGVTNDSKFKGEGKFNRKDQISSHITAVVIDVKPNGNLVLEARETIQTDREVSTLVISGTCRGEDITRTNSVQSNQLANMNLRIEHEGDVKDSSEKGVIPRVLDSIFNF